MSIYMISALSTILPLPVMNDHNNHPASLNATYEVRFSLAGLLLL